MIIGAITKSPEVLKFVPDNVNTKNMCQNTIKKLDFIIMYIYDQYKTLKMCNKVILENVGLLKFIPECYKNQEICDKAVGNIPMYQNYSQAVRIIKAAVTYSSSKQFVPDQNKFKGICNKAVDICGFFCLILFLIDIRLKKFVIKLFPKNL